MHASMRQSVVALWLVILSSVSLAQEPVRGILVWTPDRQTLTACDTGKVYWVRILASNPYHNLSVRVEKLSRKNDADIIAELRGDITAAKPSAASAYNVDAKLIVTGIVSVAHGEC